jgi:hypothetical protein
MRVTDIGIQYLASAAQSNREALSAHNTLVDKVALTMAASPVAVSAGT